jgi:hypothetical protein
VGCGVRTESSQGRGYYGRGGENRKKGVGAGVGVGVGVGVDWGVGGRVDWVSMGCVGGVCRSGVLMGWVC